MATHYDYVFIYKFIPVGASRANVFTHIHVHCPTWAVTNGTVPRIEIAMSRTRSEKEYEATEEGKRDQLLRHDWNSRTASCSLRAGT